MSRYFSYLNSAVQILEHYKGEEPFASFLKKYFGTHKKYGSKDRKLISHLCYCYFRLGKSAALLPPAERMVMAFFLCSAQPNDWLAALKLAWNEKTGLSLHEKCAMLNLEMNPETCSVLSVFPWPQELSESISHEKFAESFFYQPDLFLRVRPGKTAIVHQKLQEAGIDFSLPAPHCIAVANSAKIDKVLELDRDAVVQDYSSQKVGELLSTLQPVKASYSVWDCCAASGGKSILAHDILGQTALTVSDIRQSILHNLKSRFDRAGIKNYRSFVADLSQLNPGRGNGRPDTGSTYDLIICDAPCTGSGTWSRTPEQLYYFNEDKIAEYAALQKRILSRVIPQMKASGHLLYITCSVFKKENEEVVDFIKANFGLHLVELKVLKGYAHRADTLFAALFEKRS